MDVDYDINTDDFDSIDWEEYYEMCSYLVDSDEKSEES